MNRSVSLTYLDLNGQKRLVSMVQLRIIANGQVKIRDGWWGERINYSPETGALIEFRSGPECAPGFQAYESVEVTEEYVKSVYGVDGDLLKSLMR